MASTVADVMVATLKASGVRRVYGLPGDSLNGFTDALRRDGEITWQHVRHEEAAGFAAAGEAALTGELAVCAGSCGPGNLHLINGLFDANRSRVPVLAIAAHIPREEIGRPARSSRYRRSSLTGRSRASPCMRPGPSCPAKDQNSSSSPAPTCGSWKPSDLSRGPESVVAVAAPWISGRPNRANSLGLRKVTIRAIPVAVTVGTVTASAW
jgi:hypothetical protein